MYNTHQNRIKKSVFKYTFLDILYVSFGRGQVYRTWKKIKRKKNVPNKLYSELLDRNRLNFTGKLKQIVITL